MRRTLGKDAIASPSGTRSASPIGRSLNRGWRGSRQAGAPGKDDNSIQTSLCCLFLLLISVAAFRADTLTGEARGGVFDIESRTPLQDAMMTLVNVDRGWRKQGMTDADGNYVFLQLEPGNYSVTAEKLGYYSSERTDILIRLNQPKVVIPPFELRRLVATPTQQILVQGEQTRIAVVDLTTPGPNPSILAYLREPGTTSMATTLDWALRANFDSQLIEALPLRGGRSFDQLSLLSPGVFRVPFTAGEGPAVGLGVGTLGQFSVNGLRSRSNNFTVDGSDNNDEDIGVRRQGFVALVPQSIESVQEFQVMTAGFPAEFGRNSGSMVNAVSRSGRQQTHGAAYGLFNRSGWNAGNPFNPNPDGHAEQYGGVAGGPLLTDRVFYFVSAERQSSRSNELGHFVVPTADERGLRINATNGVGSGFVPITDLGNFFRDRNIPYSSLAGQGVFSLYPFPNNPSGPFGEHTYSQTVLSKGNGFTTSGRIDWYLTPLHSFAARYNLTDDQSIIPFTGDSINSSIGTNTRTQNVSLFLNSTPAPVANALRFSFGRTALNFPPGDGSPLVFGSAPVAGFPAALTRSVGTRYGTFGPFGATGPIGQVGILPYSRIGVDVFNFPQGRVDNTYQVSDFVSWTRTDHTLKAGFDIRRSQLNSFSDRNSRPLLLFGYGQIGSDCQANPFCVFATGDGLLHGTDMAALGASSGFLQTLSTDPAADTTIGLRFTQYDFFIQDNWRVRPNFTVNAGLRYELYTVPTEVNGRIERTFAASSDQFGHLDPAAFPQTSRGIIQAGNAAFDTSFAAWKNFLGGRSKIYAEDYTNLGPRFGFAWDPSGDGKTAIRGGYSITFDANLGAVTSQSRNVFPTFVPINLDLNFRQPTGVFLNSPTFFNFIPTQAPLVQAGTLNVFDAPAGGVATALGTLLQQAVPVPGASLSSNGLAFTLPERDYKSAYAQHFVFSVERQLRNDYLVSIAGVSTHGLHLARFGTPNGGLISTPLLFSSPAAPLTILDQPPRPAGATVPGRLIPGLGAFTVFENSASSSFSSLQFSVEKRLSRNLQFRGNWTWSHALDEVSDPFDSRGFYALPQDAGRYAGERASANFDVRHRLSGFAVWSRGNWQAALVTELQAGQPFTVNTAIDRNGDGNLTDRLNTLAGLTVHSGEAQSLVINPGTPALSVLAPRGQDGLVGRNTFRTAGISIADVSISRRFNLGSSALDLRLETFNLFNSMSYGIPVRILESPGFGHSYDMQINPRTVRLNLKMSF